jgi:nucleoside-triphosphatase THEP1
MQNPSLVEHESSAWPTAAVSEHEARDGGAGGMRSTVEKQEVEKQENGRGAARHILLTGERGIGKSTIIHRYCGMLGFVPGGFLTLPRNPSEDGGDSIYIMPYTRAGDSEDAWEVAVRRGNAAGVVAYPEVFDRKGVEILKKSKGAALIVLDELGFMENKALLFQAEVLEILDGDTPVLGVVKSAMVKKTDTAFLNAVRTHPAVKVIEVTAANREGVCWEVADFWA